MQTVNPAGSYLLRLDRAQRDQLDALAHDAGIPIQHYIELQLFGRIKPRVMGRPRKNRGQLPLPLTEEASLEKSA